jgi:hypothetical protein
VYWEGEKQQYQVKRFAIEPGKDPVSFITEHPNSKLAVHSLLPASTGAHELRQTKQ